MNVFGKIEPKCINMNIWGEYFKESKKNILGHVPNTSKFINKAKHIHILYIMFSNPFHSIKEGISFFLVFGWEFRITIT